jgi:methylated-DNA-[protein]-cysteine S-methyltransferase
MAGTSATAESATLAETVLRTPLGRDLYLACNAEGVIASRFTARARRTATARHAVTRSASNAALREAVRQIEAYFARRLVRFELPLVLTGTPFQVAVWHAVAALRVGDLASYAEIARAIGRPNAHRGVASALAQTPLALLIPAHRVVGADGTVRGATPGSMRRRLLAFEGSRVR